MNETSCQINRHAPARAWSSLLARETECAWAIDRAAGHTKLTGNSGWPQASAGQLLDAHSQMQERMKQTIRAVDRAYDQVVIDCAPGLSQLVWGALRASDMVLIPYIPDRTAEDNAGWLAQRLRVLGRQSTGVVS